jgi:hypothetical protein
MQQIGLAIEDETKETFSGMLILAQYNRWFTFILTDVICGFSQ